MNTDSYEGEVPNTGLEREQNEILVKCIGDKKAIFICTSEDCHIQNRFNCGVEDCKCQTQHQHCSKTKLKSILKAIQQKSLVSDLLKKSIEQSFGKMIDQLRDIKDQLLGSVDTRIKFAEPSQVEKDFLAIIKGAKLEQGRQSNAKKSALVIKEVNENIFKPYGLLDQTKRSLKMFEQSFTQSITNFQKELDGIIDKEMQSQKKRLKNYQVDFNLKNQIQKLKSKINVSNPSLEDIKSIIRLSIKSSQVESAKIEQRFKNDRKKFNKKKRNQNLEQYVKISVRHHKELCKIITQFDQQRFIAKFWIGDDQIDQYRQELLSFNQKQMSADKKIELIPQSKQLSLDRLKKAYNQLIHYMATNKNEIIQKFHNISKRCSLEEKLAQMGCFIYYVFDQVFQNQPEIDEEIFYSAQQKFKEEIKNEKAQFEKLQKQIHQKLSQRFISSPSYEMFGFYDD